jgi:hypothetical protein
MEAGIRASRTLFPSCPGLTGASTLDPPVEPGGDKKGGPWVKTLPS